MRCLPEDCASVECLLLSSGRQIPGGIQQKTREAVAIVSAASNAFKDAAFIGDDVRFAILYLYVIGRFLPEESLVNSLGCMLELIGGESVDVGDNPFGRLTLYFLQLAIRHVRWPALDTLSAVKFTAKALKAWLTLAAESEGRSMFFMGLVLHLEDLLFLSFSNGFSSLALIEYESEPLVRSCLKTKVMVIDKNGHRSQGCLLGSMITADPVKLSPAFLRLYVEEAQNNSYGHLFDHGLLDTALCAALDCQEFVKDHLEDVLSLAGLLNTRATRLLSLLPANNHTLDGLISVLLTFTLHTNNVERETLPSVVELLTRLVGQRQGASIRFLDQFSGSTREKILELALRFCIVNRRNRNDGVGPLSSALLFYLCETLPRCLRLYFAGHNSSDATEHTTPLRFIGWLCVLLSSGFEFDSNNFAPDGASSVTGLVRACLRYGIRTNDESNTKIRWSCLKTVRSLLTALQDKTSPIRIRALGSSWSTTLASQVFTMLTSHSKFCTLMAPTSTNEKDVKLEAVRILLCCLSATDDIEFNGSIWSSLLSCFNASMSEMDLVLRPVLSLYGSKAPNVSCASCSTKLSHSNLTRPLMMQCAGLPLHVS
jgi:hypothetical protein